MLLRSGIKLSKMSLMKFLKAPIKLFQKDVITFLRIRRYDLNGVRDIDDELHYIAVGPNASISVLREKVWHLLNLPDFCDERILLKSCDDQIIPLTNLRKGNDPQHSYILEVWPPTNKFISNTTNRNMLTIENYGDHHGAATLESKKESEHIRTVNYCSSKISNETMPVHNLRCNGGKPPVSNNWFTDLKKSDISCRISNSTIFKVNGRKSRDNFTNILIKIQSDLNALSNKLSTLENRIAT